MIYYRNTPQIIYNKNALKIMNQITMTRKSGEHLRTIYGNTEVLFRPY